VFICSSSRIPWLFMYQGVIRMDRRVLDWKRWRISVLELEAVPRSWIPYVHVGLSTALYRSLLSVDSVDLLSIQCICFAFWLNYFLLVLMCSVHVSLLSKLMPRYLTSFFRGRSTLLNCTAGQVWLLSANWNSFFLFAVNYASTYI
jgi:hypothetical protein